jgi:hypothetical protein
MRKRNRGSGPVAVRILVVVGMGLNIWVEGTPGIRNGNDMFRRGRTVVRCHLLGCEVV